MHVERLLPRIERARKNCEDGDQGGFWPSGIARAFRCK